MYWVDTYYLGEYVMKEYKWLGKEGRKGEKRARKNKRTTLAVQRYNQRQREKKTQREIVANFKVGDLWVTLKYPKGTRVSVEELQDDFTKLTNKVKYQYKKRGEAFKWIVRMEIGEQGGVHLHMITNRIDESDKIIQTAWEKITNGHIDMKPLYDSDGFEDLAKYICKMPTEEIQGQLSLFDESDRKKFIKTSSSRNLIRPEPVRKKYNHWTMGKILAGNFKPEKGFKTIEDSVEKGMNLFGYMTMSLWERRITQQDTRGST